MAELVQGNVELDLNTGTPETPVWTKIPGVTSAAYTGGAPREIDATDFDTPAGETETIYGARPNPPLTFEIHLDPGNTTQELLFTAYADATVDQYRLRAKTKGTIFEGRIQIGESHAVDGKMTASASILPIAAPVRSTVTP